MREQLELLPPHVASVAWAIINQLRLSPRLGAPARKGILADIGALIIKFSEHTRIVDRLAGLRGKERRGDEDPSAGPPWRIVYVLRDASGADVKLVQILAVGLGHPRYPESSAYELAEVEAEAQGITRRT